MTGAAAPTARTEVAVAALDGLIYVVGGFEQSSSRSNRRSSVSIKVEAYDPATNHWSSRPDLPIGLHHAGAAGFDGALYVVGGFTVSEDSLWNPSDRVFRFNPAGGTWIERAPLPTARGGLAVTTLQGRLYAVSGYDGQENPSAVEVYDPARDQWTAAAPLPTPRDHLAAVSIGETLYAIGGRVRLDYRENLSTVEAYQAKSNQWIPKAAMPTARSGIAAGVLNGWAYVFGGESGEVTFHQNERYSARFNRWQTMAPMPTSRHGLGAAAVDGSIYVLTGGPRPGGSYSRLNEIFIPPSPSRSMRSGRTPAAHIGSIMALLATFHEAGVLPPESSREADRLIHALIQSQSLFLNHRDPVARDMFVSALSDTFGEKKASSLSQAFAVTGWTSETLEALVAHTAPRSMADKPHLAELFLEYNVTITDWKFVGQVFAKAREQLLKQGKQVHAVFAAQRASMPGARRGMP
jgi:N-acetylneuraminic acid mutarotase